MESIASILNIKIVIILFDSSLPAITFEESSFGEIGENRYIIFDKNEREIWSFPFLLSGGKPQQNISVISHNSNGMNAKKLDNLLEMMRNSGDIHDVKILMIQESHQTKFSDDRFERFALPGPSPKTGGVCIFTIKGMKTESKTITQVSSKNGDLLMQAIAIQFLNENDFPTFCAISIYITPKAKSSAQRVFETMNAIDELLTEINATNPLGINHPIVVAGDLNIDPVRDSLAWEAITTTFKKHNLHTSTKNLNSPTHTPQQNNKKARLDHIFYNTEAQISEITIHHHDATGHYPISTQCRLKLQYTRRERPISRHADIDFLNNLPEKIREKSTNQIVSRLNDICEHIDRLLATQTQVDNLADRCRDSLFEACDGHIPVRNPTETKPNNTTFNTSPRPPGAPYFWTSELTNLKNKSNESAKKLKNFDPFKFAPNQRWGMKDRLLRKCTRYEKKYREHYIELENAFTRSRKMWDKIRDGLSIHGLPKHRSATNSDAKLNPAKAHESAANDFAPKSVPDEQNRWEAIANYVNSDAIEDVNVIDYMGASREVTPPILRHVISKMSNNSCNGTDGISTQLLKLGAKSDLWCNAVCALINACTHNALWPTSFDTVWVTTVYKQKNLPTEQSSSFRRICVTPKLASLVESCINTTMFNDPKFDAKLAYGASQSGFVPGSGSLPQNAMIQMALDHARHDDAAIFSCDISQAFDSIPHISIIEGAIRARCSRQSLRFIIRYLGVGNESQGKRLQFPDSHKDPVRVNCGVTQGSAMSPNLYAMSQNLIDDCIPPNCGITITAGAPGLPKPPPLSAARYADDTNVLAKHTKIKENSITTSLHGNDTHPGLISAFKYLGNILNGRKSTLLNLKSSYDAHTEIGRCAFTPVESTELPAQSPVRILGVDYFSHTDDENKKASARQLAQDPRNLRANIAGFDAYISDVTINAIERMNFLKLSLLPSSTYGAWISNFTGDFTCIDKSLIRGIRSILGIPLLSDPRDGYEAPFQIKLSGII